MSTRTQYEADLAALKGSLAKMSQLSADAVEDALEALCTADAEEAKGIIKGDTEVNRMERDIEHRCMTLLLRQQPVASDLRFISAAMKVVTDVERIGDHAADIAEIVPHLAGVRKAGDPAVSRSIEMGRKAHKMLQDAMSAFAAEDEAAAKAVIDADGRGGLRLQHHQADAGVGDRRRPRQSGRRAGCADGHQVPRAHRRPRREHRRVGGVPAHGPVSPREDVLSSVFLFFFS